MNTAFLFFCGLLFTAFIGMFFSYEPLSKDYVKTTDAKELSVSGNILHEPPAYRVVKLSNGRYGIQYYTPTRADGYYLIGRIEDQNMEEQQAKNICADLLTRKEKENITVTEIIP